MSDKMPPLPDSEWFLWCQNAYEEPYYSLTDGYTDVDMHAYARAYAAQMVAPLVEALEHINDWCCYATEEDINARLMALQKIGVAARAALAAEKELQCNAT